MPGGLDRTDSPVVVAQNRCDDVGRWPTSGPMRIPSYRFAEVGRIVKFLLNAHFGTGLRRVERSFRAAKLCTRVPGAASCNQP
jgi:hypothetical protein